MKAAKPAPADEQDVLIRYLPPRSVLTSDDWERTGGATYQRTTLMTREELDRQFPDPRRKRA